MNTVAIRPASRLGAILCSLTLLAAGCVGAGELGTSPAGSPGAGSLGAGSPGASPPPSTAESPSPNPSPSPSALPETLAAKTWVISGPVGPLGGAVAGTLDGRFHLALPPDEVGLTAADFRVVSVIWTRGADGWVSQSTLVVRDLRQAGAEIARFVVSDAIVDATIRNDHVYLAGNIASPGMIGGLYEASLADGAVRVLIPPSAAPDAGVPGGSAATGFAVSPSGRTVAQAVCRSGGCTTQVLDLGTGRVRELSTNSAWPWWVTETTVIVGDDGGRYYAYDLSGRLRWAHTDRRADTGYPTSDGGRLIVQYEEDRQPGIWISSTDLASGAERVLQSWGPSHGWLWAHVSTDDVAVVLPSGVADPVELVEQGSFQVDLLDLRTGALTPGAVLVSTR